jgi:hypothetical protein
VVLVIVEMYLYNCICGVPHLMRATKDDLVPFTTEAGRRRCPSCNAIRELCCWSDNGTPHGLWEHGRVHRSRAK